MPGAKPPQPEAPVQPVKAETTAAALQLLQPKAPQEVALAANSESSISSVPHEEPSKPFVSSPSSSVVPAATVKSTLTAAADGGSSPSPTLASRAELAMQRSPSPPSDAAVETQGHSDVHIPPDSDVDTHSDASDGDEKKPQFPQRNVLTNSAHVQSVGACSTLSLFDV
jgi:hypothetical protein